MEVDLKNRMDIKEAYNRIWEDMNKLIWEGIKHRKENERQEMLYGRDNE